MKYLLIHSIKVEDEGKPPTPEFMEKMGQYVQQEFQSGVLLAAEGVQPSAKGARVRYTGGKRTVTDGPFTEAKEVIAGFGLINANSLEEAIESAARFIELFPDGEKPSVEVRLVG